MFIATAAITMITTTTTAAAAAAISYNLKLWHKLFDTFSFSIGMRMCCL
jgi:hypothetical protein